MGDKNRRQHRYRKNHTAQGVCIDCTAPAEPGYLRSRKHLEQNAEINRRRRRNE